MYKTFFKSIKHIYSCFDDNSYNSEPSQSEKAISLKHLLVQSQQ